jgi:hypothetical protein
MGIVTLTGFASKLRQFRWRCSIFTALLATADEVIE